MLKYCIILISPFLFFIALGRGEGKRKIPIVEIIRLPPPLWFAPGVGCRFLAVPGPRRSRGTGGPYGLAWRYPGPAAGSTSTLPNQGAGSTGDLKSYRCICPKQCNQIFESPEAVRHCWLFFGMVEVPGIYTPAIGRFEPLESPPAGPQPGQGRIEGLPQKIY